MGEYYKSKIKKYNNILTTITFFILLSIFGITSETGGLELNYILNSQFIIRLIIWFIIIFILIILYKHNNKKYIYYINKLNNLNRKDA